MLVEPFECLNIMTSFLTSRASQQNVSQNLLFKLVMLRRLHLRHYLAHVTGLIIYGEVQFAHRITRSEELIVSILGRKKVATNPLTVVVTHVLWAVEIL